jgi:hypothetical protein
MTSFDVYNRDQEQPAAPPDDAVPSFDVYDKPKVTTPLAARGPLARMITGEPAPVGYWEDTYKGVAGGLGRGVAGTLGLPGTVGGLVHSGLSELGVPESAISTAAKGAGMAIPGLRTFQGPDTGQVQDALEKYTGPLYQPQHMPGQFASTIAEFAPGALVPGGGAGSLGRTIAAKTLNTVAPAVASESAGQLFKGTVYEPWARGIAGIGGGLASAKAITPMRAPPAPYAADVATLEKAGIPLTAGQRTGSKSLQYLESNAVDMPGVGARPQAIQDAARVEGLNRAVTQRVYGSHLPPGENLPGASAAGQQALSDEYKRLTAYGMRSNPQMQNRMTQAVDDYEHLVQPHKRTPNVVNTRNDIIDRLVVQQGQLSGKQYQAIRSQIKDDIRGATNSTEKNALKEIQLAMQGAMETGLPPAQARAWRTLDKSYALQKAIEPAVANAATTGSFSPAGLARAVKSRRGAQYAAQSGDLDALAQAAARVMKPLPNSGTAARTFMQNIGIPAGSGGTGATIGGLVGGPLGASIGAVVGAASPAMTARLATSRLGQAYLGNRALPQDVRDIITQTLVQQGVAQPEGAARSAEANLDYKKKQALRRVMIDTPGGFR